MTEQLALVDVPAVEKPRPLTDRQELVLVAVAHAGHDGLTTDEAGAAGSSATALGSSRCGSSQSSQPLKTTAPYCPA